jgi:protein-S-isoprenylcysteine O-methyltransferase Ste14
LLDCGFVPNVSNAPPAFEPAAAGRAARAIAGALAVTALDALLLMAALGGLAALLRNPRALALLAVWAAGGIVLALLRPVRVHEPVAIEPESKATLAALLLVPLLTPPLAALGERLSLLPWFAIAWLEWMGVAAVAAGLAVRIAAMARLGSRFSPLVTVQRDHALETRGVYAWVRHPGYFGALLACAGAMLAFGSALALPLVVLFYALLAARIAREEVLLEQRFGDAFRDYRARTGGLLPRLGSRRGA